MRNAVRHGIGVMLVTGAALLPARAARGARRARAAAQPGGPGGAVARAARAAGRRRRAAAASAAAASGRRWRSRSASRPSGDISAELNVVGNLIGAVTVDVVPRTAGRLVTVNVKLGDRVSRGQQLAKIEDQEINEQVKQAEASHRGRPGHHPPARGRPEVRGHQPRSLAEPVRSASCCPSRPSTTPRRAVRVGRPARSGPRAVLAGPGAARGAAHRPGKHQHHLAGQRLRRPAQRRPRGVGVAPDRRWSRWSTSARCGWSPTSSRRTCAWSTPATRRASKSTPSPARRSPAASPASRRCSIRRPAPREIEIEVPNADFRLKPGMYARMSVTIESRKDATLVPEGRGRRLRRQARRLHPDRRQQGEVPAARNRHRRRRSGRGAQRRGRRRHARDQRRVGAAQQRHAGRRRPGAAVAGGAARAAGRRPRRPGGRGGPAAGAAAAPRRSAFGQRPGDAAPGG